MRKLIKFEKTPNCIIMRVKSKRYSNQFYFTREEIDRLFKEGSIVAKDIYNFVEVSFCRDKGIIFFNFSWLSSCGNGVNLTGYRETVIISYKFEQWCYTFSEENDLILLDSKPKSTVEIVFQGNMLKKVVENPIVRNKFRKFARTFLRWEDYGKVVIGDDFSDYSFYFVVYSNNKFSYNGGIIFHKDYDEPENLNKGYYQIHT